MAALNLDDLPYASPELIWKCIEKTSKYKRGRIPRAGADSYFNASTEEGNIVGYHLARDTGVRHLVTFELTLDEDEESFVLTEIEPHNQKPIASKTNHTISAGSSLKTCYEDILKITHEKRPDLDRSLWYKLMSLYTKK
eukprot:g4223.t1